MPSLAKKNEMDGDPSLTLVRSTMNQECVREQTYRRNADEKRELRSLKKIKGNTWKTKNFREKCEISAGKLRPCIHMFN